MNSYLPRIQMCSQRRSQWLRHVHTSGGDQPGPLGCLFPLRSSSFASLQYWAGDAAHLPGACAGQGSHQGPPQTRGPTQTHWVLRRSRPSRATSRPLQPLRGERFVPSKFPPIFGSSRCSSLHRSMCTPLFVLPPVTREICRFDHLEPWYPMISYMILLYRSQFLISYVRYHSFYDITYTMTS